MDPLFGGLLTGGMSLFGNLMGQSNNQAMMQQQQAFQAQMSNTAYQRASQDMTAAGLNPMMMFSSGSAASTPSGAAPMQSPMQNMGDSFQKGVNTAVAMKTANATIDNLVQQNANLKAQQATEEKKPPLLDAQFLTESARSDAVKAAADKDRAETKNVAAALPTVANRALQSKNESDYRITPLGRILDATGAAGRSLGDIVSPIGNIISSAKKATSFNDRWSGY